VAKTSSSSATKAVLDLRNSALDGEPNARSDVRPKVRVSFPETCFLNSTKNKKLDSRFFFLILYFGEMEINYRMKFLVSCVRNVVLELKKSYVVVVLVVRGKKKGVSDTGAKRARSIFSTFFCFFWCFVFVPHYFSCIL
jgi:hypothetical protein